MSAVVADTHAIFWHLLEPVRLSANADAAFEQAARDDDPVYLSAITLVEARYLVEKGKINEQDFQFLTDAIEDPSNQLVVVSVDYALALAVRRIPRVLVADMPDRIIAATAMLLDLPLITRDARIHTAPIKTIW